MTTTVSEQHIEQAAGRLLAANLSRTPCAPVRDLIGADDVDAAYAVQQRLTEARLAAGGRISGRKIGLTSESVQRQLGVYQPDFGMLFADTGHGSGEPVSLATLLQPRVEAEVAFVLGSDIDDPDVTAADVLRAVESVVAAIEIVDSRIADWDIRIADTVADNASGGRYVLGTERRSPDEIDLPGVGMVIEYGGLSVSTGTGAACMGSPMAALTWLAAEVARRGAPLRAGEIVLSGALGPVVPISQPGTYTARLTGLGDVTAVFEA